MKLERLSSGSYRVRKMINGKKYQAVFDHKPSDREIMLVMSEKVQDTAPANKGTFEDYAYRYIDSKKNILSPASIRTYNEQTRALSEQFRALQLYDLTQEDIQIEINNYSATHAPKTTRALHGFIASVLGMYRPQFTLKTALPRLENKKGYIPSSEDIKRILTAVNGTEYSIPFQLGVLGLRRGEICALDINDLSGRDLTINKTMVYNQGWIIKRTPKTDTSSRTIRIPDKLADEIKESGVIYDGDPKRLNKHLQRVQKQLGIPPFRFHDLRHYFASYASALAPEADVMAMGGWKSDHIFKKIYRDSLEESRLNSMEKISNSIL